MHSEKSVHEAQNQLLPVVPLGYQVIVNDMACINKEWKQYRFPKSKKVRIRKKWSKRNANFRMKEVHRVIKMSNKLFVSSLTYEKLNQIPQV